MLSVAPPPTIYLHSSSTDMRKSFDVAADPIQPLIAHLREVVRAGPIIGTDETTVTRLAKNSPLPGDTSPEGAATIFLSLRRSQLLIEALPPEKKTIF